MVAVVDVANDTSYYLHLFGEFCTHSESFNWGYMGRGPAQLAFAILMDMGAGAAMAWRYHQDLKRNLIAALDTQCAFKIDEGEVLNAIGFGAIDRLAGEGMK
jgi:hypothetical protein